MNEEDDYTPSKSQLKRESDAAQKLGENLLTLKPDELAKLDLPDDLLQAVLDAHKISSRSALKRHRQYIGKLMRSTDNELISKQLAKIQHANDLHNAQFKKLEAWRDRLLDNDKSVLSELIQIFPDIDRQHINQLIRQAIKEQAQDKPPISSRKLFKYLRDLSD